MLNSEFLKKWFQKILIKFRESTLELLNNMTPLVILLKIIVQKL